MKKLLFKKIMAFSATVAVAATAFTSNTFAAEPSTSIIKGELTGGDIGFKALPAATLTGSQLTTATDWSIGNVIDARGSGTGWNVSLTLTPFKEVADGGSYVTNGKSLSASSLKVSGVPTVAAVDETSSDVSTISRVANETALDTGSAVKILSASANGGMGSYTFGNLDVTLTIPASAYATTYKTDATVSLNTAP